MSMIYLLGNGYVSDYISQIKIENKKYVGVCRSEKKNCDIICFPELSITGYPPEDLVLSNQFIYSVIVSLHKSVPQSTFDYACQKIQKLEAGQIVKVPFGKKAAWGVIEKLQEDRKDIQIKQIIKVFDGYILSGYLMRFINWVAEWNFTSKGSVLKLVLSNIDIIAVSYTHLTLPTKA